MENHLYIYRKVSKCWGIMSTYPDQNARGAFLSGSPPFATIFKSLLLGKFVSLITATFSMSKNFETLMFVYLNNSNKHQNNIKYRVIKLEKQKLGKSNAGLS